MCVRGGVGAGVWSGEQDGVDFVLGGHDGVLPCLDAFEDDLHVGDGLEPLDVLCSWCSWGDTAGNGCMCAVRDRVAFQDSD